MENHGHVSMKLKPKKHNLLRMSFKKFTKKKFVYTIMRLN